MHQPFELIVRLTFRAPIISSGSGDATRGMNRIFYRNTDEQFALQGSHLKGKLREAMHELLAGDAISEVDLTELFGHENAAGHYLPEYGALRFGDFIFQGDPSAVASQTLTRVSIDAQTGTSKENFLQVMENIARVGANTEWEGKITFFAADGSQAKKLSDKLISGLKWIAGVGAIKGSGYGRLEEVGARLLSVTVPHTLPAGKTVHRELTMIFTFDDDLFIGGVKNAVNYLESQRIIPGAVIKGSLARFLNEHCGNKALTAGVDVNNKSVQKHFSMLPHFFSDLRISHAFPGYLNEKADIARPVTVPFSAIRTSRNEFFDVAQLTSPCLDKDHRAPEFRIDWKDPEAKNTDFGWAKCEIINKTRTAIDPQTRRALEDKLYTFQYIPPYVAEAPGKKNALGRPKIKWVAHVRFPELAPTEEQRLLDDFNRAIQAGWQFLGKRGARFTCEVIPGHVPPKINSHAQGLLVDGLAIIALQTDALLFDGRAFAPQGDQIDLPAIYRRYWQNATKQSCDLERFFARQKLWGGYLGQRYRLGANYYPFVLTEAGSVFVLRAIDEHRAKECLQEFKEHGLPLPKEIMQQIAAIGKAPWEACPFVRENGYGEINLNLEWHWKNSFLALSKGDRK